MATPKRYPWEQLDNEPDKAYKAFQLYLELQSKQKVDEAIYGPSRERRGLPRAPRNGASGGIQRWAKLYNWGDRLTAWNAHLARERTDAAIMQQRIEGVDYAKRLSELDNTLIERMETAVTRLGEMLDMPTRRHKVTREERDANGNVIVQNITIEPVRFSVASLSQLLQTVSTVTGQIAERRSNAPEEDVNALNPLEVASVLKQIDSAERSLAKPNE